MTGNFIWGKREGERSQRMDYNDYCSSQSEKIILNEVHKTN